MRSLCWLVCVSCGLTGFAAAAGVPTVVLSDGDPIPGDPANVISGGFSTPAVSADGTRFAMHLVSTKNFGTDVLVAGTPDSFTRVLEQGDFLPAPINMMVDDIDRLVDVNNNGQVLFRIRENATNTVRLIIYDIDTGLFHDTGIATDVPVPGFPTQLIRQNIEDFAILEDGRIGFEARSTEAIPGESNPSGFGRDFIVLGNTLLVQGSNFVPTGTTNAVSRVGGFPLFGDFGDWMTTTLLLNEPSGTNDAIVVNGALAAQEGTPLPSLGDPRGVDFQYNLGDFVSMGRDGTWMFHGSFDTLDQPRRFVALNGQAVALSGQPIVPGAAEIWSPTNPFTRVKAFSADNVLWSGRTAGIATGIVEQPVIVRTSAGVAEFGRAGDPVDTTGDGVPDADIVTSLFPTQSASSGSTYWMVGRYGPTVNGASTAALFKFTLDCPGDFDGDGDADNDDITAFLMAVAIMDPTADVDGNSVIDFFDVLAFLSLVAQGC